MTRSIFLGRVICFYVILVFFANLNCQNQTSTMPNCAIAGKGALVKSLTAILAISAAGLRKPSLYQSMTREIRPLTAKR